MSSPLIATAHAVVLPIERARCVPSHGMQKAANSRAVADTAIGTRRDSRTLVRGSREFMAPRRNDQDPRGVEPGSDSLRGVADMRMALVVAAIAGLTQIDAYAQGRFDVGLLLGSTRATDEGTVLEFDRGTTYQATFAWRIASAGGVRWSVEVPFLASPAFTIVPPRATLPLEYASLYLTPGIRATVLPN